MCVLGRTVNDHYISEQDWCLYEHLLRLLGHVRDFSKFVEADSYVTMSAVLPGILHLAYNVFDESKLRMSVSKMANEFVSRFKKKLFDLLDDPEQIHLFVVACALDGTRKGKVRKCAKILFDRGRSGDWPKLWRAPSYGSHNHRPRAEVFEEQVWRSVREQVRSYVHFYCSSQVGTCLALLLTVVHYRR